jgi:hypothetical protein
MPSLPARLAVNGDSFAWIATRPESPFTEDLACAFLADFVDDEDPLVAEVARFEMRMIDAAHAPRQSGV